MSYNFLPNLIFIFSILGIVLIFLKHLPETTEADTAQAQDSTLEKLQKKGLPAQTISKIKVGALFTTKKIWNFILEAKDLKPHAAAGYKIKKLFFHRQASQNTKGLKPGLKEKIKTEQDYLDQIKLEPKNLTLYDALGKFYLEQENYADARDIYQYLVNHQPASPDYQARLAYCFYQLKDFEKAAEHYKKSLALDSTQPNRYYNLGLSLENAGKIEDSVEPFEQALALEPSAKFYVSLSNAYKKLGLLEKADQAIKLAKKLKS